MDGRFVNTTPEPRVYRPTVSFDLSLIQPPKQTSLRPLSNQSPTNMQNYNSLTYPIPSQQPAKPSNPLQFLQQPIINVVTYQIPTQLQPLPQTVLQSQVTETTKSLNFASKPVQTAPINQNQPITIPQASTKPTPTASDTTSTLITATPPLLTKEDPIKISPIISLPEPLSKLTTPQKSLIPETKPQYQENPQEEIDALLKQAIVSSNIPQIPPPVQTESIPSPQNIPLEVKQKPDLKIDTAPPVTTPKKQVVQKKQPYKSKVEPKEIKRILTFILNTTSKYILFGSILHPGYYESNWRKYVRIIMKTLGMIGLFIGFFESALSIAESFSLNRIFETVTFLFIGTLLIYFAENINLLLEKENPYKVKFKGEEFH